MFDYQNSLVLLRGKFVPFKEANVSIASSPVLYGLAVYTVFNVRYDSAKLHIFRLKDHYDRLCNSARIMDFTDFTSMMNYEQFEDAMISLLKQNNVHENVLVRASLFIDELIARPNQGLKN